MLGQNGEITVTQGSISLEALLGKFIFSASSKAPAKPAPAPRPIPDPMRAPPPSVWPMSDGSPIACREKLRTLTENHDELAQVMQDAFEDAVLMGVDETAFRALLSAMVAGLRNPLQAA